MKNRNRTTIIILLCIMLCDLFLLFLDWLDLRCFLDRGPVTFQTIRQFFTYPYHRGPMIELIVAVVLGLLTIFFLLNGRRKTQDDENPGK